MILTQPFDVLRERGGRREEREIEREREACTVGRKQKTVGERYLGNERRKVKEGGGGHTERGERDKEEENEVKTRWRKER